MLSLKYILELAQLEGRQISKRKKQGSLMQLRMTTSKTNQSNSAKKAFLFPAQIDSMHEVEI